MDQDFLSRYERVMNPGLARAYRFMGLEQVEARGRGAVLIDEAGNEYLDLASGYGVMVHGYGHPRIVAAAHRQLDRLAQSSRMMPNRPQVELAEELARVTPGRLESSFFSNSGAEAVEAALKLARAATGRPRILGTLGAFHGKTMGALSASGRALYQDPFRPLVPAMEHVPYGDSDAMRQRLGEDVAAVIVEPIQGEGGIVVPPDEYLPAIREATRDAGALLIVDEVQTGMGRTGKLFATEWSGVEPDLMCLAKGLGGGVMPIGATVGTPEVWEVFRRQPLVHSSTFGGSPLATAVALEALRVVIEEGLAERARELGTEFGQALKGIAASHPDVIREVRGRGLMWGIELGSPGAAAAIMSELFAERVLAVYTLNNERVIRLIPPLVISRDQIGRALEAIGGAVANVAGYVEELEE